MTPVGWKVLVSTVAICIAIPRFLAAQEPPPGVMRPAPRGPRGAPVATAPVENPAAMNFAPFFGTNTPSVGTNGAVFGTAEIERRTELEKKLQEVSARLEALLTEDRTRTMDVRVQHQTLAAMVTKAQTDDEETVKLQKRLAELDEEAKKVRESLKARMETMPEYKAAVEGVKAESGKITDIREKQKETRMEKARIAGEIWRLNKLEQEARERAAQEKAAEANPGPATNTTKAVR